MEDAGQKPMGDVPHLDRAEMEDVGHKPMGDAPHLDRAEMKDVGHKPMGDAPHLDRVEMEDDAASLLGEERTLQEQEAAKKRRKKTRRKQPPCPSDLFIRESIEQAHGRIRRELTALVLDELRRIYIEAYLENGQFFDLLDSGLALSSQGRERFMGKVIVTMRDGAKLGLTPAEHVSISYYRPGVEFRCVQQLGNNWFRVKDETTGQLMLLKKEMVLSDWRKGLRNFLRLPPEAVVLVPYAVICDRSGSILYLTEDRDVTGFGRPRGMGLDYRMIFKRCLRFLSFCWQHGLHPGDFNSNVLYSGESIYFDPTSLTGGEDLYTFNKSLKAAFRLLFEAGCQPACYPFCYLSPDSTYSDLSHGSTMRYFIEGLLKIQTYYIYCITLVYSFCYFFKEFNKDLSFDSFLDMMWHSGERGHTDSVSRRPTPVYPGLSQDPIDARGFGD